MEKVIAIYACLLYHIHVKRPNPREIKGELKGKKEAYLKDVPDVREMNNE